MQNFIFFLTAIIANIVIAAIVSPLATRGEAPPPEGGGLTWCYTNQSGFCSIGIHNNFETQVIGAYIFDSKCNLHTSTDQVITDSNSTITWNSASGTSHAGYIYVHDVTGGEDEFWHDGVHYQGGWMSESPLPVYYEYRSFGCGE